MNPTVIVCPIDLSAADDLALAQALRLTRWHGAELHVVHVRGRRAGLSEAPGSGDAIHARLAAFIDARNPQRIAVTSSALWGDAVAAVATYARRKGADLIVVAQQGGPGSGYWPAGAYAAALGRAVECPTIAVPATAPAADADAPFSHIVCAVDFSDASLRGLRQALTLAQQGAGRVTLLHVLEGFPYESVYSGAHARRLIDELRIRVEEIERELDLLVPPSALDWCEVSSEAVSGVPHDVIRAVAIARDADLVVLGLPRRSRLQQLVAGSTTKRVLRNAPCPVLIVPGGSAVAAGVTAAAGAEVGIRPMGVQSLRSASLAMARRS